MLEGKLNMFALLSQLPTTFDRFQQLSLLVVYPARHGFLIFFENEKTVSRNSDAWIVFLARNSSGHVWSNLKKTIPGLSYNMFGKKNHFTKKPP